MPQEWGFNSLGLKRIWLDFFLADVWRSRGKSDASTEQRKGKRVEISDQLPSQPLANLRNVGQASSSRTHNVNKVRIDGASEEAHAISGLRSGKVLVDPHTDHKRRKDPLEERDDRPSPTIILEDSEDEGALMEDHARDQATSRVEPDGARVLPRRSTRADVQDPGFKYTA